MTEGYKETPHRKKSKLRTVKVWRRLKADFKEPPYLSWYYELSRVWRLRKAFRSLKAAEEAIKSYAKSTGGSDYDYIISDTKPEE